MRFSRRDFLSFAGFTVLGVAGGKYLNNTILPRESYYLDGDFRNRKEEIRSGICGMCPAGCGIRVRLVDGLPVKLDGNPDCPISRGRLCPKGQMGLELHCNPDRIASPLRRSNSAGSEKWEQVSWDDALSLLQTKIGPALQGSGNGVAVICHEEQSIASHLWSEFHTKYGDRSRLVTINHLRDRAILSALKLTMDVSDWPVYDIENSDFLLVFDTPLVSGLANPTSMIGKYASFRRGRELVRGRMVFVGCRRSMEAANADEDLRVAPYTSAVLAMGLAHVIIRERLYDEAFVAEHCIGFEELKTTILKHFRPKRVSEITGVAVGTINSVARRFAGSVRPVAIGERLPEPSRTWEQTAYLLLNALKGSIGVEGGVLFQERVILGDVRPPEHNIDLKDADSSPLERLMVETENGNVPDVLLIDKVEPSTSIVSGRSWSDVMERIPFVVSFSPYPNLSTSLADLVLPDLGFLEKHADLIHAPSLGYPSAIATDATATAIGNGMDTRLIQSLLIENKYVVEAVADTTGAAESLNSRREKLHRAVFNSRRGLIYDTPFTREWVRRMESGGWWASDTENYDEFDEKLRLKGGWADPYVPSNNGDNRFLSDLRKFNMKALVDAFPTESILAGKIAPAPPELSDNKWMKLTVVPTTILSLSALPYGNIPHLLEFPEPGIVTGWEAWLELHPSVASLLKVSDEGKVRIKTRDQERVCRVLINENLHPSAGALPFAMFGLGDGRWVEQHMKASFESLAEPSDDGADAKGIVVQIRKA